MSDNASPLLTPIHPKIKRASERPLLVKAIIYGEPGSGKTYLSCTAPNPLILLTEPAVSDTTMQAVKRDLGVDVPVWEINELSDLEEAYFYLQGGEHDFETVVIDSLTDLYRRLIRSIIDMSVSKRPDRDPDIPEQGDWFKVSEKLRYLVRLFRDLPMHVVFTALTMDIRKEMLTVPFIQPKSLAQELPAFCNLVGYLGVAEDGDQRIRKLLVEPTEGYVAKNPGGALPALVGNPNLTEIFEAVRTMSCSVENVKGGMTCEVNS